MAGIKLTYSFRSRYASHSQTFVPYFPAQGYIIVHTSSCNWHQRGIVLGPSIQDGISLVGYSCPSKSTVRNSASWYISMASSRGMFSIAIAVGSTSSQPHSNHLVAARSTHGHFDGKCISMSEPWSHHGPHSNKLR